MGCWFNKSRSKDKVKSAKKKEAAGNGKEGLRPPTSEEAPSNVTKQKVAAAKQYIENHYKNQMKSLEERKERYTNACFYLTQCNRCIVGNFASPSCFVCSSYFPAGRYLLSPLFPLLF